jgi:CHAT domain-containing protein/tetratricopeptide (TPR) repeat protein
MVLGTGLIAPVSWRQPPQDRLRETETLIAGGLYERAEARARAHVNRLRTWHGDDSLQVATALDVLVKALVLNGRGTADETLALANDSLRTKEALLGKTHPDLTPSLLNLGNVLTERAEFDQAIAVTERAVAVREASTGLDSLGTAEALDHLGAILSTARRHDDALTALERSLNFKEGLLEKTDPSIAGTLADIGLALQRKGEYEKSGIFLHRAAVIEEALRVNHPVRARTLNLIAQQLWFEGQLLASRDASERAVDAAERLLRPDHPTLALSLRYLAATLEDLGDMERSIALRKRALGIAERTFGANHHETAVLLHSLGSAEFREGAYATARQHFRQALSIYEARYGPWHEYVAAVLSMLARADASLGDYATARREHSRVVSIRERISPNHPFVAIALTDMANMYREEGSPAQALPLLERALAIREVNLGPNHRDVARTLAEMAATLQQRGETTQAQAAATRALGIWERLGTPNAPEYATALALYADLQARRGDDAAAVKYYERALAIRARVFGTSNPAYADIQAGLALSLADLGDRASALTNAVSAEATGRDHLRAMLRSLPERQSLEYAAVRPRALDLIVSLTGPNPDATEMAMDGLIRSRALVLDEMAARRRSQQGAIGSTDPLRLAYSSAQQRLANLVVRGPGALSPVQYAAVLDDARRDSERAEQALAERSAEFRAERSRAQLGLAEVRASLPADSALVSFLRYDRTVFTEAVTAPRRNGRARTSVRTVPSYLAFVMIGDEPPAVVPLGPAQTIDSLVSQWRGDIALDARASEEPSGPSRVSGAALRRLIWDRAAAHLGNEKRVFIVPDGALSLVPFAALPVGRQSYLLESAPVLHYLSAERDLVPESADTGRAGQGLLALGGPAFDDPTLFGARHNGPSPTSPPPPLAKGTTRSATALCDDVQNITFPTLKGTLQEVQELSRLWSTSAISHDEESRVLVGRDASEPALKRDAHRYRVLHFATHGFFFGDSCSPARPGTRAVGGLVSSTDPASGKPKTENPLLLSGLALAGANRRQAAAPDEDDGILTAEEVALLNFEGVEWAVLSACDTGLGRILAGEGVFGLRRAFQIAGARTVIMSLWSVEDDSTRLWMRALYEGRLKRNLSTADAMHEASLTVLNARRAAGQSIAPFFWAAFVAAGDWR